MNLNLVSSEENIINVCCYLSQQGGDDVQWSLVDGLILQW